MKKGESILKHLSKINMRYCMMCFGAKTNSKSNVRVVLFMDLKFKGIVKDGFWPKMYTLYGSQHNGGWNKAPFLCLFLIVNTFSFGVLDTCYSKSTLKITL